MPDGFIDWYMRSAHLGCIESRHAAFDEARLAVAVSIDSISLNIAIRMRLARFPCFAVEVRKGIMTCEFNLGFLRRL